MLIEECQKIQFTFSTCYNAIPIVDYLFRIDLVFLRGFYPLASFKLTEFPVVSLTPYRPLWNDAYITKLAAKRKE